MRNKNQKGKCVKLTLQGKNWGGKEVVGLHVFNYKNGHVNLF